MGDYVYYGGESSRLLQVYEIRNGMIFAKTMSGKTAIATTATLGRLIKVDISKFSELERLIYGIT